MWVFQFLGRVLRALSTLLRHVYQTICGGSSTTRYEQLSDEAPQALRPRSQTMPGPVLLSLLEKPTTSAQLSTHAADISALLAARSSQTVKVMRHGHRQDELDRQWTETAERPWDPPLSAKGRLQAQAAGVAMRGAAIDLVVTSPFVRCLQTSAEIVAQLGLPQGAWLVDWGVCEVLEPRLMFAGRTSLLESTTGKGAPVDAWMWGGTPTQEALRQFGEAERVSGSMVAIDPELWGTVLPVFPERLEAALQRYERSVKAVMQKFEGKNVLIVTHGEALRATVCIPLPLATVYEVTHTGHVPLSRAREGDGRWGPWGLDAGPGDTGVLWYV